MWLSIAELLNEELSQALPSTTARWTQTRFEATDRLDRTSHRTDSDVRPRNCQDGGRSIPGNAGAYTGIWGGHTHGCDIRTDGW